jgi:hypothetical protein
MTFERRPGGEAGAVRSDRAQTATTRREAALEAAREAGAEIETRDDGTIVITLRENR